ncbi:MAG: hypothetical protein ACLGIJ_06315 [Candidatus Limnocylindria bacterium]
MSERPAPEVSAWVLTAPSADAGRRAEALPGLRAAADACGGLVLATCHRVTWLAPSTDAADAPDGARVLHGAAAVRHVIRLAVGLESAVVGEDQVLHQLRTALADARRVRTVGGDLGLLVDRALRAGRRARSWRPAVATSLADRALDAAIEPVAGGRVLVVGTGSMGRLAAAAAIARGATVRLAGRDPERTAQIARETGATGLPLDPGVAELDATELVVVALAGPWLLSDASAASLCTRPRVVDLSSPPALAGALREGLGDRLVDIDRLAVAGPDDAPTSAFRARLERLAAQVEADVLDAIDARRRSVADRLAARVEAQRRDALEAYLRARPDVDPAVRAELDALSRSLSTRLFREPLARLADDPDGRRRVALDELFGS